MAMSLQERRKKDRERKATERAEQIAAGVPAPEVLHRAIVEANAFALAGVNIGSVAGKRRTWVDMNMVVRTTLRILCLRGGYDFEATKAAIMQALAPREEHKWPSNIPSLNPLPGGAGDLERLAPRQDVSAA